MKELKNRFLHNVKDYKRLICIALCAVMALMLIGCAAKAEAAVENEQLVYLGTSGSFRIYRHEQAGVYYLADKGVNGLTVMLNADGTPYTGE